jgi:hypothetical protein
MGAQLISYYDQVTKEFGLMGRMKLAMLTKTSSDDAQKAVDSPEKVKIFEQAVAQLRQVGVK